MRAYQRTTVPPVDHRRAGNRREVLGPRQRGNRRHREQHRREKCRTSLRQFIKILPMIRKRCPRKNHQKVLRKTRFRPKINCRSPTLFVHTGEQHRALARGVGRLRQGEGGLRAGARDPGESDVTLPHMHPPAATHVREHVCPLQQQSRGKDRSDVATTLVNLSSVHESMSNAEEARKPVGREKHRTPTIKTSPNAFSTFSKKTAREQKSSKNRDFARRSTFEVRHFLATQTLTQASAWRRQCASGSTPLA